MPELLTLEDIAAVLQVSKESARKACRDGVIPSAFQWNGTRSGWRINSEDFREFIINKSERRSENTETGAV